MVDKYSRRVEVFIADAAALSVPNLATYSGFLVGTGYSLPGARITRIYEFSGVRFIVET